MAPAFFNGNGSIRRPEDGGDIFSMRRHVTGYLNIFKDNLKIEDDGKW